MSRTFGVTSTVSGFTYGAFQTLEDAKTVEIAETRDKDGKVIDQNAYSKNHVVSAEAVLDSTDSVPDIGSSITAGDLTGLASSVTKREVNTGHETLSIQVEKKDAATQVAYSS